MKILNANFLYSVPKVELLKPHEPTVVFLGRSNVGKSSLINALCHRKDLARIAKKPGQTKHAVVYELLYQKSNTAKKLFLIDLPGYGYAKMSQKEAEECENLIDSILTTYEYISLICLLLDCRRELDEREINILKIADTRNIKYQIILTKADKLTQSQRLPLVKNLAQKLDIPESRVLFHSTLDKKLSNDALHSVFK